MQHEITHSGPLLDRKGRLREPGWAKRPLLTYDRDAVGTTALRLKEWDYYYVGCGDRFGLALTVADNGYMGLDSISFLNFEEGWEITKSPMQVLTRGRKSLPPSSGDGSVRSAGKGHYLAFRKSGASRILTFKMEDFKDGAPIEGALTLADPEADSIVIATPFDGDKKAFYYNQKINCLPAGGTVRLGRDTYTFSPENSFGVLDWGRGVWTYKNTWFWGSASGAVAGVPFGFNIGYGFGNTEKASENALFLDGRLHKLSRVRFLIPKKEDGSDDFLSPWRFTSDDRRFEMTFTPVLDRASCTDFKILCSDQHQVFGRFSGRCVLDDGAVLQIRDLFGFAEKVFNKW